MNLEFVAIAALCLYIVDKIESWILRLQDKGYHNTIDELREHLASHIEDTACAKKECEELKRKYGSLLSEAYKTSETISKDLEILKTEYDKKSHEFSEDYKALQTAFNAKCREVTDLLKKTEKTEHIN